MEQIELTAELRAMMKAKCKNIKKFAEYCNLPYTSVMNILQKGVNHSTIGVLIPICEALEISADALCDGRIEPSPLKYNELDIQEVALISRFRMLNMKGKEDALKYIDLLANSEQYKEAQ